MSKIIQLNGAVCTGCQRFRNELTVLETIGILDDNWIGCLEQGTLNIQLNIDECRGAIQMTSGKPKGLRVLDENSDFLPSWYIKHTEIVGNTINPEKKGGYATAGDGQFWRAEIHNHRHDMKTKCYLVRRVKSGYWDKAEIMGDCRFKENLAYMDGDTVTVTVYSTAQQSDSEGTP